MIPPYEDYNQINITKDWLGKPILSNAVVVDYLDFNDTTVFNNQLDRDIKLVFTMLKPKKDGSYSPDSYTIRHTCHLPITLEAIMLAEMFHMYMSYSHLICTAPF
jgi:hypothetical protein